MINSCKLSEQCIVASVGAALITNKGNIYTGISIDAACGIGFCAEHSAIAEMVKNNEQRIDTIVAVHKTKGIIPPCGRCREMMYQIDKRNKKTKVIVKLEKTISLDKLLPLHWQE